MVGRGALYAFALICIFLTLGIYQPAQKPAFVHLKTNIMNMSKAQIIAITIVIAMFLLTLLEGIIKFMPTGLFIAILIHGWGAVVLIFLHKILFTINSKS